MIPAPIPIRRIGNLPFPRAKPRIAAIGVEVRDDVGIGFVRKGVDDLVLVSAVFVWRVIWVVEGTVGR